MSICVLPSGHYRVRVRINNKIHNKVFTKKEEAVAWEHYLLTHKREMSAIAEISENVDPNEYAQLFTKSGKLKKNNPIEELFEIDAMSGRAFEKHCIMLFELSGLFPFAKYSGTKISGDYGADIIITTAYGLRISVQCKRLKNQPVRIEAVQAVVASKQYYKTDECLIITNSRLTVNAAELAEKNGVVIIDREKLIKLIEIKNDYMKPIMKKTQWQDFIERIE